MPRRNGRPVPSPNVIDDSLTTAKCWGHLVRSEIFYEAIADRLSGDLDPNLFEDCATELLRKGFWTLVPIRGGDDASMDGTIADSLDKPHP